VWSALTRARGSSGRDALWSHPDLVPGAEALADPVRFAGQDAATGSGDAMDAALAELLDSAGGHPTGDPDGGSGSDPDGGSGSGRPGPA
jgi:hypothetical protein